MKSSLVALLLLSFALTAIAQAMDPPGIEWVRTYFPGYYTYFRDISETSDGGFIATAVVASDTAYACYKFDEAGDLLWAARSDLDNQGGRVVRELPSGDFVVAGFGRESPSSSSDLMLSKYDSSGNEIWTKLYDSGNEGSEVALSISLLPNNGFAACGQINPSEGMDQAWVLCVDSEGDTLWTREWGWDFNDKAVAILYLDNGLTVLMHGNTPSTPGGPHLVRFDMDGNLLWETEVPLMSGRQAGTMCEASDGGLLILSYTSPLVVHTDYQGNLDWQAAPQGWDQDNGWSISTTMDGGFIVGVETTLVPDMERSSRLERGDLGIVSRHSVSGDMEWWDFVYDGSCDAITCIRQLSQGGYIAAGAAYSSEQGQQGILIKYAPETGIAEPEPSNAVSLAVSPNPFSSDLSIDFSLPLAGEATVQIYDLDGRLVSSVVDDHFTAGSHAVTWTPSDEIAAGCYLLKLETGSELLTETCVLLR